MTELIEPEKIEDLPPFQAFLASNIPAVYDNTMSYYDELTALIKYIQDTLIPAVNTNQEAVVQLQGLYTELKAYVDNYFANLDVQQEINNKLDQMAEDGTLTALIKNYVDPYINAQNLRIDAQDNAIDAQNTRITAVESTVAGYSAGGPTFVNSTDDMTDEDKIYVLNSDGSIYYYDGTEFVDSGVDYGANILSFTGVTTLVASTTQLDDFNNALPNRTYMVTATNIPNQPVAKGGTLVTFRYTKLSGANRNGSVQLFFTGDGTSLYKRINYGNSWKSWANIQMTPDDLQQENWLFTVGGDVSSTADLADFNDAKYNKCYLIFATDIPNQPVAEYGSLVTFCQRKITSASPNGFIQMFITRYEKMYVRYFYGNSWGEWKQVVTSDMLPYSSSSDVSSISAFEKIGVIGDSFASGTIDSAPEGHKNRFSISWPQIMARRNGFTAINFSAGGLSTRTWLTSSRGLTLLNSSDPQDLYMIALGINDIGDITEGEETLGSIADIDLNNPATNPNTFYGNYGKILSAIKTKNADAKVILVTIPKANTGNNLTINNAIIEISTTFDLPIIISHSNPVFTSDYFRDEKGDNGHPTVAGYGTMADAYTTMANECIANYYEYFKDYLGREE